MSKFDFLAPHHEVRYQNARVLALIAVDGFVGACKGLCFLAGALLLLRFALS